MRAGVKPFVLALALVAVLLVAQTQPAAGRGSSGIVGITNLGSGERESWVFIANEPPECLVVFLHAAGRTVPAHYIAWLDYLAGAMSCAVIFPRYQLSAAVPASLAGLRAAVSAGVVHVRNARFGFERDPSQNAVADGRRRRRPGRQPRVLLRGECKALGPARAGGARQHLSDARPRSRTAAPADSSHDRGAPPGERRRPCGRTGGSGRPAPVPRAASRVPQAHRDDPFEPGLKATEASTLRTTAAAEETFWTPLDALIDGSG